MVSHVGIGLGFVNAGPFKETGLRQGGMSQGQEAVLLQGCGLAAAKRSKVALRSPWAP